jgi:hypothetical protein
MYPVKHKLKECTIIKNFMTSRALTKSKEPKWDPGEKGVTPFLGEEAVMAIYAPPPGAPHV